MHLRALLCGLAAFLPALGAHGQTVTRSQDYFQDVIALSDVLGKAHAVRAICNGRNDQYWRSYMQRVLDLEAPYDGGLRSSMISAFNAGFAVSSDAHRVCDSQTVAAEKGYAAEGSALTNRLAAANIPGGPR